MADIAAAILSDGRLQVWVIDKDGRLHSRYERAGAKLEWTPWSPFEQPGQGQVPLVSLVATPSEDKNLQLFALDRNGERWATCKTTADSHSPWKPWSKFS